MNKTKSKITQGTWNIKTNTKSADRCFTIQVNEPRQFRVIADLWNGSNIDEAEANAKIISAAPDLLDTLKNLLEQCEFIPKEVFTESGKTKFQNALNEAQTAIKKATK